jgi:hypothetical protein
MAIDADRLLWIVTGVQLNAELGDRPLAYRIESEIKQLLATLLPTKPGEMPRLAPAVVSDVYYLNSAEAQDRPVISVGGPGVNGLSGLLSEQLQTAVAIDNVLVVQMDLEMADARCCVWGMTHVDTVRAVEMFIAKGYLKTFVEGVIQQLDEDT